MKSEEWEKKLKKIVAPLGTNACICQCHWNYNWGNCKDCEDCILVTFGYKIKNEKHKS